jgi:hypothetical protein
VLQHLADVQLQKQKTGQGPRVVAQEVAGMLATKQEVSGVFHLVGPDIAQLKACWVIECTSHDLLYVVSLSACHIPATVSHLLHGETVYPDVVACSHSCMLCVGTPYPELMLGCGFLI